MMVNEFSEYARAPVLNLVNLDFNALVRDVLELYQPVGISLEVALTEQSLNVLGDATMLRQVLHNLLQNAQDALDGVKSAKIEVATMINANQIQLSVADNGAGFPMEMMSRAFEPYMTTKRHGTGLGLAIVKKIVEEHQGNIAIENVKAELAHQTGAVVLVSLPMNKTASKKRIVKPKKVEQA